MEIELQHKEKVIHPLPVNLSPDDEASFIGRDAYFTNRSTISEYEAARVSSMSVIYKNFVVVSDSIYLGRNKKYYQTRHLVNRLLLAKKVSLNPTKRYLLATDQESEGHFHWLTEVLPRLWQIRDRASEFVLMLPDRPYIRSIGTESLDLLKLSFSDVVWMKNDELYDVPHLFHLSNVAVSGHYSDRLMTSLRSALVGTEGGGKKRLYVSRRNERRRRVLNDEKVIEMLKNYGFEVYDGVKMSLKDQISLFSQCETLVGLHGAGLTNAMFMLPGNLVELKIKEPTIAYWHLAGSLGHDYYYYNGIPDSNESLIGTGCNLSIPVADFEETVIRLLHN